MGITRRNDAKQVGAVAVTLLAASLCVHRAAAGAPELVVAISPDIPPYVMEHAARGIEVDLARAVFPDRPMRFVQMPYDEVEGAVAHGRADAALPVHEARAGVFYSKEFVTFANAAITKRAAAARIDGVADLKGRRVLAWQDAYLELGEAFQALFSPQAPQRKDYVEVADQREQVRMFWQAPDDVIVIDRSIFAYFSREMGHAPGEAVFHDIFPPVTPFRAGFKDAAVRDAFDRGLAAVCRSGEYATVLRRYHVELPGTPCTPAPR